MSDYCRNRALRYPIRPEDAERIDSMKDYMGYRHIPRCGYFELSSTDKRTYLDYVIYHSYGDDSGEFGKTRALTEAEQNSFRHLFEQFFPHIDMSKVRLVDYCWYNCCEPPDYYDPEEDPFYEQICNPSARWINSYQGDINKYVRCSNCTSEVENNEALLDLTHCPCCGAKIEGARVSLP